MHILVTGNMGYVGSVLVETIRENLTGATITGLDNGYFASCLTRTPAVMPETLLDRQLFYDVRDLGENIFENVDAVIHLSAVSNDPMGNLYKKATDEINHQSSLNIAKEAKNAGVQKFVFASSCSVYGQAESASRTEDSEVNPLTPYARSKVEAEEGLRDLADPDFHVTCLRFATACGPSPRLRLDLVLNDFVTDALVNGNITILSDGSPWRPLIDVRDMGKALVWAAAFQNASQPFSLFNAGCNDWNFQVRDLAFEVQKVLGGTEVSINSEAAPDKRSYKVDFSRFAEAAGGFAPEREISETISALRELLVSFEFEEKDFRGSDLIRLRYLDKLIGKGLLDEGLRWG